MPFRYAALVRRVDMPRRYSAYLFSLDTRILNNLGPFGGFSLHKLRELFWLHRSRFRTLRG